MGWKSRAVLQGRDQKLKSKLVQAMQTWGEPVDTRPQGVFGSVAVVRTEEVTIRSDLLDLEFSFPFDDDLEPNEGEIVLYNLSDTTVNRLGYNQKITVEAGYQGDTGLVFSGFITKVTTKWEGPDKVTTLRCLDDIENHEIESISYGAGTSASTILRELIDRTGLPVEVFQVRRDHVYEDAQQVEGDLMEAIGKYGAVCGISVYVSKGRLYARHIKEGDNLEFLLTEATGLLGTPAPFEEEVVAEDFKEVVHGYKLQALLQHRIAAGAIVGLESRLVKGQYRVRQGRHLFNESECITEMEVV